MSIENDISKLSSASAFSKLPVPQIDSIEVYSDRLDVQISVYITLTDEEYKFKEQFEDNCLSKIRAYVQLAFDRAVTDNNIGAQFAFAEPSEKYQVMPPKAFTNLANGERPFTQLISTNGISYMYVQKGWVDITSMIDSLVAVLNIRGFWSIYAIGDSRYPGISGDTGDELFENFIALSEDEQAQHAVGLINFLISEGDPAYISFEALTLIEEGARLGFSNPNDYYLSIGLPEEEVYTLPQLSYTRNPEAAGSASFIKAITTINNWNAETPIKTDDGYICKYVKRINNIFSDFSDLWTTVTELEKVGLICYTTNFDLEANASDVASAYNENSPERLRYEAMTSPASYKMFASGGTVTQEPISVYVDDAGTIYENPIQTIDRVYHGSSISLASIVQQMQALLDPSATNPAIIDAQEELEYVLSVHGDDMDLLVHLNTYRKTFINKVPNTPIGNFYESFKSALLEANRVLSTDPIVTRSLVNNPVVKDLRTYSAGDDYLASVMFDETELSEGEAVFMTSEFIDMRSTVWSRYTEVYGYQSGIIDRTVEEGVDDLIGVGADDGASYDYALIDHGYFFFNYEKALKTQSALSALVDVTKYEKLFGHHSTNQAFQMMRFSAYNRIASIGEGADQISESDFVTNEKFDADAWDSAGVMDLYINNSTGVPKNDYIVYRNINDAGDSSFDYFKTRTVLGNEWSNSVPFNEGAVGDSFGGASIQNEEVEYSFVALRNFKFISNSEIVDPNETQQSIGDYTQQYYRIAAFEYQKRMAVDAQEDGYDIETLVENSNSKQFFTAGIEVRDTTAQIIVELYNRANEILEALEEYTLAAADYCSYNNISDSFNQFFINAASIKFPVQSQAPYVIGPVMFFLLDDLLYDTFDGVETEIYKSARDKSAAIGPEAGSLSALEAFKDAYEQLVGDLSDKKDEAINIDVRTLKYGCRHQDDDNCTVFVPTETYANYPTNLWRDAGGDADVEDDDVIVMPRPSDEGVPWIDGPPRVPDFRGPPVDDDDDDDDRDTGPEDAAAGTPAVTAGP